MTKNQKISLEKDFYVCREGSTIFPFGHKMKTLSTSALNGGLRTDLKAAVNINCQGKGYESEMLEDTYEKELMRQCRDLGVDGETATALSTAAWTELSAVCEHRFRDLTVRAVVSGGIDYNAVAPGDPTSYYEEEGKFVMIHPGTINMFVFINQNLTDGAMVRAMMLCSEAKAAAVQELMLGSCYSRAIATGSGTDGCVIASDMEGDHTLTDASGHSKLGELIGRTVKEAVRSALLNQTAANGARQFQLRERVRRYGITTGTLYDQYVNYRQNYEKLGIHFENAASFDEQLRRYNQNSNLVLIVSLYLHLLDQKSWGLIMSGEIFREGRHLLQTSLYVGKNQFLGEAYPAEAFCLEHYSGDRQQIEDPVHLLEHYLILFLGNKIKIS